MTALYNVMQVYIGTPGYSPEELRKIIDSENSEVVKDIPFISDLVSFAIQRGHMLRNKVIRLHALRIELSDNLSDILTFNTYALLDSKKKRNYTIY